MAIDKKMLQRFLDNPANVSADEFDMEDELPTSEESERAPAGEEEEVPEMEEQEPELDDGVEVASAAPAKELDSEIMSKLKRLKSGQPADEMDEEEAQDVSSDTEAPIELRKKALQQIKQKYLGQ